jgi:hypothetical protein
MLHVACCMLHVARRMVHVVWCTLYVACCVLHVARCTLPVARRYAAEALCLLHRPAEAAAHLAPTILPAASPASSAPQHSQPSGAAIGVWSYSDCPTDLASPAARALLYLNLAAVHILQDNLGHASAAVTQAISVDPSNSRAILTAAYLEMRKGIPFLRPSRPPCCIIPFASCGVGRSRHVAAEGVALLRETNGSDCMEGHSSETAISLLHACVLFRQGRCRSSNPSTTPAAADRTARSPQQVASTRFL